jgi:hypothetical protein
MLARMSEWEPDELEVDDEPDALDDAERAGRRAEEDGDREQDEGDSAEPGLAD